jgi:hypothetical protein
MTTCVADRAPMSPRTISASRATVVAAVGAIALGGCGGDGGPVGDGKTAAVSQVPPPPVWAEPVKTALGGR